MNVILIEPAEPDAAGRVRLAGRRAAHIRLVLRAKPGDRLRIGLVGGPLGTGVVRAVGAEGVELDCAFEADPPPDPPPLDLLLAPPRPKVLKRLWPALAQLGVRRIGLLNAERVERPYFDSHVLEPDFVRASLLEGCEQAGLTRLPEVSVHRRFRPFVEDDLPAWSPGARRILADPGAALPLNEALRHAEPAGGVLLAVGPEGGWNAFERERLMAAGFSTAGLTGGALRSDVACIALLAVIRERLAGPERD